jgi:hypothetical protein
MNQKVANSSLCSSPRSSPATVASPVGLQLRYSDTKMSNRTGGLGGMPLWHLAENVARTTVPDTSD